MVSPDELTIDYDRITFDDTFEKVSRCGSAAVGSQDPAATLLESAANLIVDHSAEHPEFERQ